MTESEFNASISSGAAAMSADDFATAEPEGGAPPPLVQSIPLSQFLPILLQLQSVQSFLSAAPTFIPQTFQEQIQFVYTGGVYYLYLYINNQWSGMALSGSSGTSINGLSTGSQTLLLSGAGQQVEFSANAFANGITWDGAHYQFVVQTAGQYLITSGTNYSSSISTTVYSLSIEVNGSAIATDNRYITGNNAIGNQVTAMANLSVGDVITVMANQGSVNSTDFTAAYLGIAKV